MDAASNERFCASRQALWKVLLRAYLAFALAFLGGALLSVPFIYNSVTRRFRGYTETTYDVGNSHANESALRAWANSLPGIEKFVCERQGTNLWVRWEYRGYTPPKEVTTAPLHLREFGYEFRGMFGGSSGAVPRDTAGMVTDVLTDSRTLAAILFCTQATFGIFALVGMRSAAGKERWIPSGFAGNYWQVVVIGTGTGVFLFALGSFYSAVLGWALGNAPASLWNAVPSMSWRTRACLVIFSVLIAPSAEELFFRGYLFGMFKRAGYVRAGVLVSSAFFAAAHISDPYNVPAIFFFGVTFALVYHRTGSLAGNMIAHAVTNALAIAQILRE